MFDLAGVFFLQLAKAGIRVAEQEEGTFDLQSLATTGAVAVSKVDLPGAGILQFGEVRLKVVRRNVQI